MYALKASIYKHRADLFPAIGQVQSRLMTTCTLFLSYNTKFAKAVSALSDAVEQAIDNGEDWSAVSIESQTDTLTKFEANL